MPLCKCGSGRERQEIAVKEFGHVACCKECRKSMVRSIREAAGDCEPEDRMTTAHEKPPTHHEEMRGGFSRG